MRYDDRLATVLRLTPVGPNVARIQFRQLLDLLGTTAVEDQGEVLDLAYLRMAELAARIPASDRATILRQGGHRLRSPRLVAALVNSEIAVAQAAIQTAQLSPDQWQDLIPALPLAARSLLHARQDFDAETRALLARLGIGDPALANPAPEAIAPEPIEPAPAATAPQPEPEPLPPSLGIAAAAPMAEDTIGALVRRIEAFRQARETGAPLADAPPLPTGLESAVNQPITCFDFASDGEGRIVWSDSRVAPMIVGHALARGQAASAVQLHQPLRATIITLSGAPAIAGDWQIDAVPRFDPQGGRYIGHIGRFRRPAPVLAAQVLSAQAPVASESEADRLRQLLHELRTPVNAIQGFAEIIQQQLFGPTPHEYRALAASVAGDSARILAGFEELDRFARLETGTLDITGGQTDLAATLTTILSRLAPEAVSNAPRFLFTHLSPTPIAIGEDDAERLCWRLLAILTGCAGQGESLSLTLTAAPSPTLTLRLPAALARLSDAALYHAAAQPEGTAPGTGMFGIGFSLRLAGVEARAAGGSLVRQGDTLILTLPGLTQPCATPSSIAKTTAA